MLKLKMFVQNILAAERTSEGSSVVLKRNIKIFCRKKHPLLFSIT